MLTDMRIKKYFGGIHTFENNNNQLCGKFTIYVVHCVFQTKNMP